MKNNYGSLFGFSLCSVNYIEEINADCYEYIHEKSGAHLIFLDRDDENKTFAIGFKTIPRDSTGVFHIIEHSVLCGSRKFPVKDPMTELLKSSLYTYLNAFTYPDKTVYPVSSKNDKAFLDLVDVYMDAVLHPLAPDNEYIFMNEGHRLEYGTDGSIDINGIVYNEMKGAYSSVDELCDHYVSKKLFSGGTYSYDSGGFPEDIPSLSFDDFKKAHAKFYHPENSCIFLDGRVELEKTLRLLDSYLSEYDKCGFTCDIALGEVKAEATEEYYPIEEGESSENRTRLSIAWRGFDHSRYTEHLAVTAVLDGIADTNSSPLKARILSSGLCENMHLFYTAQSKESVLTAQFINVKDGACDELIALFDSSISEILKNELDRELINSSLKMLEFKTREADFGSYPRGMVYMSAALENFFYGESPKCAFEYTKLFSSLRKKSGIDYFKDTFLKILNSKRTVLIMSPSEDVALINEERLKSKLSELKAKMTDDELISLKSKLSEYEDYVNSSDTDEALATIPTLSLSDIKAPEPIAPTEVIQYNGANILLHKMNTSGIVYTEFNFDVSDTTADDLYALRLMTLLLPELDTERGTAVEFRKRAKSSLGDLSVFLSPIKCADEVKLYLTVKASCLPDETDNLVSLIREYLYTANLDAEDKLKRKLTQLYTSSVESINQDALGVCMMRVAAKYDTLSALRETLFGYNFHNYLKTVKDDAESHLAILEKMKSIREMCLSKERLTLSVASESPSEIYRNVCDCIASGSKATRSIKLPIYEKTNEGILIPSSVGYLALGGNIYSIKEEYTSSLSVAATILSYEHLWHEVRVKGGAYDTGALSRYGSGSVVFYSYRDPSPDQSRSVFFSAGEALRNIANSDLEIDKYIISTLGSQDTVNTPRSSAANAVSMYLSGKDESFLNKCRQEILNTDKGEIIRLSYVLDKVLENSALCLAGPKDLLRDQDAILEI